MTQTLPPAPQPEAPVPPQNPKAAAAAAKAYAKATRPWYKKKRFIIPGAVLVLIAVVSGTSSGGDSDTKDGGPALVDTSKDKGTKGSDNKQSEPKADAAPGSKDNPVKVGQTVELEGTRYTVEKVETSPTLGNSFLEEQADGVFLTVTLTIENTKDETKTFFDGAAKLIAGTGNSYDTDSDGTVAAMGNGEEPLWLTDMQPDLPKTGPLVFDVPPGALKGSMLEVSDLFGRGEAYINLGLK